MTLPRHGVVGPFGTEEGYKFEFYRSNILYRIVIRIKLGFDNFFCFSCFRMSKLGLRFNQILDLIHFFKVKRWFFLWILFTLMKLGCCLLWAHAPCFNLFCFLHFFKYCI